jgi:nicotinamidase-related amidase
MTTVRTAGRCTPRLEAARGRVARNQAGKSAVRDIYQLGRSIRRRLDRETKGRRKKMLEAPKSFRLDRTAFHIAIDMQLLFAEPTDWFVPWMTGVLPNVTRIAEHAPDRTLFTRFIPPRHPEEMQGAWQDYYRQWNEMTQERLDPRLLELAEPLARLCPPARVLDKNYYSAFSNPRLAPALQGRGIKTLIITGGETDVCVLATVMAAVDHGFRVVLPADALCSARDNTHDALLTLYRERFTNQVQTITTDQVLSEWDPG